MKRIAWDHVQHNRCLYRWMRAGRPIPNHVMDPTPYRLVFEPWRVRFRRKVMRRMG